MELFLEIAVLKVNNLHLGIEITLKSQESTLQYDRAVYWSVF